jgi:hypothetical protein
MIGREPFQLCMDRIRPVIAWGGEPYAQYYVKLNALRGGFSRIRGDRGPTRKRWQRLFSIRIDAMPLPAR